MTHVTRKVQRITPTGLHSGGKYRSIIVELHPDHWAQRPHKP